MAMRIKFTRMSTNQLINLVSKGGMLRRAATIAAELLEKRIPKS